MRTLIKVLKSCLWNRVIAEWKPHSWGNCPHPEDERAKAQLLVGPALSPVEGCFSISLARLPPAAGEHAGRLGARGIGAARCPCQGRGWRGGPSRHKPLQLSLKSTSPGLGTRAASQSAAQPWSGMRNAHWPVGVLCMMQRICICSFSPSQLWAESLPRPKPGRKPSLDLSLSGRVLRAWGCAKVPNTLCGGKGHCIFCLTPF